jgi:hypothetical protein
VAELLGMGREVQRRSAEVFILADYIPKNLAHTHDAHLLCLLPNARIAPAMDLSGNKPSGDTLTPSAFAMEFRHPRRS